MTTSHTPGPWKVFDTMVDGETYGIDGADGTAVVYYGFRDTEDGIRKKADAFLIAAAPSLFAEIEREYIELADYTNNWLGRHTMKGQSKLGRLRDLIATATGRSSQDVQDDYGTRAARARGEQ